MKISSRKIYSLFIGIFLTFFLLYFVGNLWGAKAYTHISDLPAVKLVFLNVFLFVTMSASIYYLAIGFLERNLKKNILNSGIITVSLFLAYYVIFSPDFQGQGVGLSYILVGDYLRGAHGINIYFMDWGGWIITMVLYLTTIFSALGNHVLKTRSWQI